MKTNSIRHAIWFLLVAWLLSPAHAVQAQQTRGLLTLTNIWLTYDLSKGDVPGWTAPGFDFAPGSIYWNPAKLVVSTAPKPNISATNDFAPKGSLSIRTTFNVTVASGRYFRASFDIQDLPSVPGVMITHLVGDGAVFYLNNVEVARWNLPAGPVDDKTLALPTTSPATTHRFVVPNAALVPGTNLLAVAVYSKSGPPSFSPTCFAATAQALDNDYVVFGDSFIDAVVTEGASFSQGTTVMSQNPIALQWFRDGTLLPDRSTGSLNLTSASSSDNGRYSLVATTALGRSITNSFRLTVLSPQLPGNLDASFQPPSLQGQVIRASVVQPDNKVIIGGIFTPIPGTTTPYLARLNADGSVDADFHPPTLDGAVYSLMLESDGSIYVGGSFSSFLGGKAIAGAMRLTPDGTPDLGFLVRTEGGRVMAIRGSSNGKIYLAGEFSRLNNRTIPGLARLNHDGTIDASFSAQLLSFAVRTVLELPDGKLLVGHYSGVSTQGSTNLLDRLFPDGKVDPTFQTTIGPSSSIRYSPFVGTLALDDDLNILAGGVFRTYGEVNRTNVVRLKPNGETDPTFSAGSGQDGYAYSLVPLPDGGLLFGSDMYNFSGFPAGGIIRLGRDGQVDESFILNTALFNFTWTPGVVGGGASPPAIYSAAFLEDGRLTLAGAIQSYLGAPASSVIRVFLPVKAPKLRVDNTKDRGLEFSWPIAGGPFVLEATVDPLHGPWNPIPGARRSIGGRWFVNDPRPEQNQFYRLAKR